MLSKTLDASNADITISEELSISSHTSTYTVDFSGSVIHHYGDLFNAFSKQKTGSQLNEIVFHDLKVYDQLEFRGDYEFNDIEIVSGGILLDKRFESNTPQIQFNQLAAMGTNDTPITFAAEEGVQWEYISKNGIDVNLEFVSIQDSKAVGATFTATNSIDNGNNDGWSITAPPDAPENAPTITVDEIEVASIALSWSTVENATSYLIELSTSESFTDLISDEEVSGTDITFTDLESNTTYYIRIRAKNISGISSYSETTSVLTIPEAPEANEAFSIAATAFTASWNEQNEVTYSLDVSENEVFSTFVDGYENFETTSTSQRVEGLSDNQTYYYRLRSYNTTGYSAYSNVISVMTSSKATQTITFAELENVTYGDDNFALDAEASSGLEVGYSLSIEGIISLDENVVTILSPGEVDITASQAGNDDYLAAEDVTRTLVVEKAIQTISFDPDPIPTKTLGDDPFEITISVSTDLDLNITGTSNLQIDDKGNDIYEITMLESGEATITASQAGNEFYEAAENTSTFTINDPAKSDQTITFEALDEVTFGEDDFTLTASASSGLTVSYNSSDETVAVITGSSVSIIGAGTTTITASQAGNESYNEAEDVTQTLVVHKAAQSITFNALEDETYGNDPITLTASGGDSGNEISFASSNESVATISGTTLTILGAGTTTITASQAGNDNYLDAEDVEQTLVVHKAEQAITFEVLDDRSIGESFDLEASATSGLEITFTIDGPAELDGLTVTPTALGTVTITASQAGNENYAAADDIAQSFEVIENKQSQTITFDELEDATYGDEPIELNASASSGLQVSYTSSNESVATISANQLTIVGAGETVIIASQDGNDDFLAAEDISRTLVVNKANQTITFNELSNRIIGESFDLDASSSSNLTVTYVIDGPADLDGNTVTPTALGTVTITASQGGNDNYEEASDVPQSFEVISSKQNQTITFDGLDPVTFGDESFQLSATASSGLDITYTSADESVVTISGNTVTIVGAGTTSITASQNGNDDFFAAEDVSQELVVNKAGQTITIDPIEDKIVSDDPFEVVVSSNSTLEITLSIDGPATIADNLVTLTGEVGTVTILAEQASNQNYHAGSSSISFEVAEETVTQLPEGWEIKVYPNPVTDYLKIELNDPGVSNAQLTLIDQSGVILKNMNFVKAQNCSVQFIDLKTVSKQILILKIRVDEQDRFVRIIKR